METPVGLGNVANQYRLEIVFDFNNELTVFVNS